MWGWIITAVILALIGAGCTMLMVKTARAPELTRRGMNFVLALGGIAITVAIFASISGLMAVAEATKENNSLLDRVGDDLLGGVVTLLPEGQICVVINGDSEDKCESRDRFLNLQIEVLGEEPVDPVQYQQVYVSKVKTQGVEGLILNPDPLPPSTNPAEEEKEADK